MLPQTRRGPGAGGGGAVDHDRGAKPRCRARPGAGVGQIQPHAARLHLRVGKHIADRVDRPGGHGGGVQFRQQVSAGKTPRQRVQAGGQINSVAQPVLA